MDTSAATAQPQAGSESNGAASSVQSTVGTKDKKPFTYTPGGLDLSEIKSETMAKRLIRNAMSPGVQEAPKSPPNRSGSLPSGQPLHSYNLTSVQVLPNIQLPANPKSLLRQTSGQNGNNDPIDRILDASIPFEIKNDKKTNGSIIEGTPIVKKNDDKESEIDEDTTSLNQAIRRNSEKLESSVEEVIEKLKLSLEEANKNLERVTQDENKTNENDEEVTEEEVEEEEEFEEEEEEGEEDVVETFTITRKTNAEEKPKSDQKAKISEVNNKSEGLKSSTEAAKVISKDQISNTKINENHVQNSDDEIEEEEIEEEEEYEETNESTQSNENKIVIEQKSDEKELSKNNEENINENEIIETDDSTESNRRKDLISRNERTPTKKEEKVETTEDIKNESRQESKEKSIVEAVSISSNHSSGETSEDKKEILKAPSKEENLEPSIVTEINQQVKSDEKEVIGTKTIDIKVQTEREIKDSNDNQRPISPIKKVSETLGELDNLPALDISPKRFSFLQEREETREEYTITTTRNEQSETTPHVKTFSPVYKTSHIQAPAFERPVQKSYHPPPPQTINRSYPHAQSYSQKPNYQSSYDKITNENIPTYDQQQPQQQSNQYYSPDVHAPQYQESLNQQHQQTTYNQVDYYSPQYQQIQQQPSEYTPYNVESISSNIKKQVEILPPWETETRSQQPVNFGYENSPSFYGSSPIPKNQPPWKSNYSVTPETKSKPVVTSTTGVLNPLVNSNKRNSWLQQTSIEQEFSDTLADTEPHWKRELREMATKPNDYYNDEVEPKAEVEPPWRRELREFSQRNNPQPEEPKLEPQSTEPPWMKEVKYRLTTYSQPQAPTSWQTQTLRPKTWREKSADIERVQTHEAPEWSKQNTINRSRPISSYTKSYLEPNYLDSKARGASVDRDRVSHSYLQQQGNHGYNHLPSYNNGYTLPWEVSSNESPMLSPTPTPNLYDRTSTPQSSSSPYRQQQKSSYGYTPTQPNTSREYATLSYQPRRTTPSRSCPVQSRSFRYLQILTGTYDGYVDDEPFIPQPPLAAQPRPGHY